jgi:DNA-binding transcriptional MocR family regulator
LYQFNFMTSHDSDQFRHAVESFGPLPEAVVWRPTLSRRKGATKHKLLTDRIIADIIADVLRPGARMPTHRDLARDLGVSVQTVSISYKEAERRGYLRGEVGRGTFVRSRVTERADRFMLDRTPGQTADLSIVRAVYTEAHERASRAAFARLGETDNSAFMRPCRPIAGLDRHRAAAQIWLRKLGVDAAMDRILITNGAAHGLFLAVAAVVRPGDVVLTERLTDHGIIGLANVLGFSLRGLPTDDQGILPDAFAQACGVGDVTALVLVPTLGNPTSHVMGAERRGAVAAIAARHGVFVIEDEVYKPLLEDRLPSITQMLPNLGFFVTSFTKTVMTGLRTGYLVTPPTHSIRVASILRVTSWSATNLTAEIASQWIEDGAADALVRVQRQEARDRQAIVAQTLAGHIAATHPLSLCAWLSVPPRWTEESLVRALLQRGIAVTPSDPFIAGEPDPGGIRICLGGRLSHAALAEALTAVRATFEQLPPVYDVRSIA